MNSNPKRESGPDIIRTLAIVCVVCGHFFSVNTPYNQVSHAGGAMLLQGCLKAFFCNLGVPFFLMLSGYFNCHKEFSPQYYRNIKKVLIPYIVISVITWAVLSADHSIIQLVLGTLGFHIIGYAWYVEMFIGLYLIAPFLNIVLQKVFTSDDKKMLWGLFVVLVFMTSLPPLVDRGPYRLVPDYWMACFPVLLYATGAYIRHFQPVIKHRVWAIVAIGFIYLQYPMMTFVANEMGIGGGNLTNLFGPYYAVPNYLAMTMLFVLLYKVEIKQKWIGKAVTAISLASYEMFLFSYLCDKFIYPYMMERFYTDQASFMVWFVPITLTVLIASYLLSWTYREGSKMISNIHCTKKNK